MEASRTVMPFKPAAADEAPAVRGGLTLFGPHPRAMGSCGRSIVNCPPAARPDTTLRLVFCRRFRGLASGGRTLEALRVPRKGEGLRSFRGCFPRAINRRCTADREFDAAAGEFAPGFDFRHAGRVRELREISARLDLRRAALERIGLAPPSTLAFASAPVWRDHARCPPEFFAQRSFLSVLVTQKPAKDPIIAAKPAAQNRDRGECVQASIDASQGHGGRS